MWWEDGYFKREYADEFKASKWTKRAECEHCDQKSFWFQDRLIFPIVTNAPPANADMPTDVRADYDEAAGVLGVSPRSSAALLRLALQRLMPHLGAPTEKLDDGIAFLVRTGLSQQIQQALDILRVVGNNAVHPGELALADDAGTANDLFNLINMIVDDRITRPLQVQALYDQLPETARQRIEERDAASRQQQAE